MDGVLDSPVAWDVLGEQSHLVWQATDAILQLFGSLAGGLVRDGAEDHPYAFNSTPFCIERFWRGGRGVLAKSFSVVAIVSSRVTPNSDFVFEKQVVQSSAERQLVAFDRQNVLDFSILDRLDCVRLAMHPIKRHDRR